MRWLESVTLGRTLIAAVAVTAVMAVALVVVAHRTRGRAHRARTVLAVLTSVCAVATAVLVASVPIAMSHGMQSFGTPLAQYPASVARSHADESSQLKSTSDIRGKVVILYRFGCPDCEAAYDGIEEKVFEAMHEWPWRVEGKQFGQWVAMDYVDVVVHIFQSELRDFYKLEELWADAPMTRYEYEE